MSGGFFSTVILLIMFGRFIALGMHNEIVGVGLWLIAMWTFILIGESTK